MQSETQMAKKREAVKMSGFVLDDSGSGRTAWQRELKICSIMGVGVNVAVVNSSWTLPHVHYCS